MPEVSNTINVADGLKVAEIEGEHGKEQYYCNEDETIFTIVLSPFSDKETISKKDVNKILNRVENAYGKYDEKNVEDNTDYGHEHEDDSYKMTNYIWHEAKKGIKVRVYYDEEYGSYNSLGICWYPTD